jgi:hypothetical protein
MSAKRLEMMVERKGIEPSTFALRTRTARGGSMGYEDLGGPKRAFSVGGGAQLAHTVRALAPIGEG